MFISIAFLFFSTKYLHTQIVRQGMTLNTVIEAIDKYEPSVYNALKFKTEVDLRQEERFFMYQRLAARTSTDGCRIPQ